MGSGFRTIGATAASIALFVVGFAPVAGCKKEASEASDGTGKAHVEVVSAIDRTEIAPIEQRVSSKVLTQWAKNGFAHLPWFATQKSAAQVVFRLSVDAGIVTADPDEGGRELALAKVRAQSVRGLSGARLQIDRFLTVQVAGQSVAHRQRARREALRKAVGEAVEDIGFQVGLSVAAAPVLIAAIQNQKSSRERFRMAIEIAAIRRVKAAMPALIGRLKHPSAEVVDAAIGALVAIDDPRAVRPLVDVAKFSDTAQLAKLIDAIGQIGGDDAREYLTFVATAQSDADIRDLAQEALARMARK